MGFPTVYMNNDNEICCFDGYIIEFLSHIAIIGNNLPKYKHVECIWLYKSMQNL